ncbi:MAG: hypothetical protein H5T69_00980 [Chloroflexi bacterium]|nr:hypothetical protein [Chloroflexota bacterium]
MAGQWVSLKSEGRVIVEAMNAMAYDALTLGRFDFALGLANVEERAKEAKFPFLSANVVTNEGVPFFEPYTIIEREGVRVAILGLSEANANQAPGMTGRSQVRDYIETASFYVPKLRPEADVLIVLSHLGFEEDMTLARAVPGIDIIVGGNTRKLMELPERVGDTVIVQQGYRGEWMGKLAVMYDADGKLAEAQEEMITLGPDYKDDPEVEAIVAKWRELYPTPTPRPTPTRLETPTR